MTTVTSTFYEKLINCGKLLSLIPGRRYKPMEKYVSQELNYLHRLALVASPTQIHCNLLDGYQQALMLALKEAKFTPSMILGNISSIFYSKFLQNTPTLKDNTLPRFSGENEKVKAVTSLIKNASWDYVFKLLSVSAETADGVVQKFSSGQGRAAVADNAMILGWVPGLKPVDESYFSISVAAHEQALLKVSNRIFGDILPPELKVKIFDKIGSYARYVEVPYGQTAGSVVEARIDAFTQEILAMHATYKAEIARASSKKLKDSLKTLPADVLAALKANPKLLNEV